MGGGRRGRGGERAQWGGGRRGRGGERAQSGGEEVNKHRGGEEEGEGVRTSIQPYSPVPWWPIFSRNHLL